MLCDICFVNCRNCNQQLCGICHNSTDCPITAGWCSIKSCSFAETRTFPHHSCTVCGKGPFHDLCLEGFEEEKLCPSCTSASLEETPGGSRDTNRGSGKHRNKHHHLHERSLTRLHFREMLLTHLYVQLFTNSDTDHSSEGENSDADGIPEEALEPGEIRDGEGSDLEENVVSKKKIGMILEGDVESGDGGEDDGEGRGSLAKSSVVAVGRKRKRAADIMSTRVLRSRVKQPIVLDKEQEEEKDEETEEDIETVVVEEVAQQDAVVGLLQAEHTRCADLCSAWSTAGVAFGWDSDECLYPGKTLYLTFILHT